MIDKKNSVVRSGESFDEALELIEERESQEITRENPVLVRGILTTLENGYQVPENTAFEKLEESEEGVFSSSEIVVEDPTPDYIPSVDEALEWDIEKGVDIEMMRVAGYGRELANFDYSLETLNHVPSALDHWDIPEENQRITRPALLVYSGDLSEFNEGYHFELSEDKDEGLQAADYAVVIDQNPVSEDYGF